MLQSVVDATGLLILDFQPVMAALFPFVPHLGNGDPDPFRSALPNTPTKRIQQGYDFSDNGALKELLNH